MKQFQNVYEDALRAESYAKLEFPGTYYLAYRDLPQIIAQHIRGTRALDFGCGTGRSTRFLSSLGFNPMGVDISQDMIHKAKELDAQGCYHLIKEGNPQQAGRKDFDLILSVFTFDNIDTRKKKTQNLSELGQLLNENGRIINLVSSPLIYTHEWASFSTKDFPENLTAQSGDRVKIIMTDVADQRPVEDILWTDEAYREIYHESGLEVVATYKPLARDEEPFNWVNETSIAPWVIYVLKKAD